MMVPLHSDMQPARLNKQEIEQLYTSLAKIYDIWGRLTESKAQTRCLELANIVDGESVLEVAVGTGLVFSRILERNPNGHNEGIDLAAAMLAQAQQKAAKSSTRNYNLRLGDSSHLPYKDNVFDVLINNYMLDLLPEVDFKHMLAEFGRVLKPGGRLILVTMAKGEKWYNQHWELIYRLQPGWLGGCRGISLLPYVQRAGFVSTRREFISQMTFPSEIVYGERDD